jgi:hypothetical protein
MDAAVAATLTIIKCIDRRLSHFDLHPDVEITQSEALRMCPAGDSVVHGVPWVLQRDGFVIHGAAGRYRLGAEYRDPCLEHKQVERMPR